MSLTRTIAHQTIIQIIAKALSVMIGIFTLGILTRYLGREGYGHYTTIFSFVIMFVIIADLGLYSVAITELGRSDVDEKKLFSNIMTIRVFATVIAMGSAIAAVFFFPYPSVVKYGVVIAAFSTSANLLDQLHVAVLQKNLRTHWVAVGEIVEKVIVLAGFYLAVRMDTGLINIIWVAVTGFLVHFTITMLAARRLLPYALAFDWVVWKGILHRGWPIAISGICMMINFKVDTIMLSLLRPLEVAQQEVGIYGAAYKILEVLIVFPSLFLSLMVPHLAHAFSVDDRTRFARIIQKSFDFFALIAWPMVGVFLAKAAPIMGLVAGSGFLDSAPVPRILILAVGINYLTHFAVYATAAIRKQHKVSVHYVIATVGALIAYALTIPRYSYFGAAWTTLAIEVYIGFMVLLVVWRTMRFRLTLNVFWKAALASTTMAFSMLVVDLNIMASLAIGGMVYAAIIWLTKGITKDQIQEIIQLRSQTPSGPQLTGGEVRGKVAK